MGFRTSPQICREAFLGAKEIIVMRYAILAYEPPLLLHITEDEFAEIKHASESLSEVLLLEEKYDIVLENMLEFEVEMLKSTEKYLLFTEVSYTLEKLILNRRVANLLTACRLYID